MNFWECYRYQKWDTPSWFVRILKDQWNLYKRTNIFFIPSFCTTCFRLIFGLFLFSLFSTIRLNLALQILLFLVFFSGQWDCWIWWFEFVFLIILNDLRVNLKWLLSDGLLTHYLCALLFHFLFFSFLICWPCLPRQAYIVFRFIIEYSSLRDFGPY